MSMLYKIHKLYMITENKKQNNLIVKFLETVLILNLFIILKPVSIPLRMPYSIAIFFKVFFEALGRILLVAKT
ncbi:MAG: hypothetical protein ACTSO9_06805 [Candidatus Helarchaeota archaeon]